MTFFGERSLRNSLVQFLSHSHSGRYHQGLGNSIIEPGSEVGRTGGDIHRRERLGGMLSYYHREAA